MEALRFFMLVLLALTLPFRGAVAQLACCEERPGSAPTALMQAPAHEHGAAQHHGHDMHAGHDMQPSDSAPADASPDSCHHHCLASCAAPAFVSATPSLWVPAAVSQACFPLLSAPPPSHTTEGPERPPRAS